MEQSALSPRDRVIIFGSTGFVGSRLWPELVKRKIRLRLFVRNKAKVAGVAAGRKDIEVFQGDLVSGKGLTEALRGIHSAYYAFTSNLNVESIPESIIQQSPEKGHEKTAGTLETERYRAGSLRFLPCIVLKPVAIVR
jgi:uncharacterized protein YbjT (DUF2867 family)